MHQVLHREQDPGGAEDPQVRGEWTDQSEHSVVNSNTCSIQVKVFYFWLLQDFINFIPDYPHTEFSQECKVPTPSSSSPVFTPEAAQPLHKVPSCYFFGVVFVFQTKNANVLGFCWTNWNEIVFITDQGIEFYQVSLHLLMRMS